MNYVSLILQFLGTACLSLLSVYLGYRLAYSLLGWKKQEKEKFVGVITQSVLGLLTFLLVLGMFSIGYYGALMQSSRNIAALLLVFSFSLVFVIISSLDQLHNHFFDVSQQPLIDLQHKIGAK